MYSQTQHVSIQVKCNSRRRSSRSKPNWDLVRGGGGGSSAPPAQENGSSYGGGSSYGSDSYGNNNGGSSYGDTSYGGGSNTAYGNGSSSYGGDSYSRAAPVKEYDKGPADGRRRSSTRAKSQKGRFRGMDADKDLSDDQVCLRSLAGPSSHLACIDIVSSILSIFESSKRWCLVVAACLPLPYSQLAAHVQFPTRLHMTAPRCYEAHISIPRECVLAFYQLYKRGMLPGSVLGRARGDQPRGFRSWS